MCVYYYYKSKAFYLKKLKNTAGKEKIRPCLWACAPSPRSRTLRSGLRPPGSRVGEGRGSGPEGQTGWGRLPSSARTFELWGSAMPQVGKPGRVQGLGSLCRQVTQRHLGLLPHP